MSEELTIHGCPVTDSHGQEVVHPTREQYLDVAKALADEGYTMALDLCGVRLSAAHGPTVA